MENKTGKYFKYAIGEIVLVVIGILIALQINNWNETKKENRFEKKVLKEILAETEEDLKEMKTAIEKVTKSQESSEFILQNLTQNKPYNDSLDIHFAHGLRLWSLSPNSTSFEMAKAEGMYFIKNDSIRTMTSKINEYWYDYVKVLESRWQDYTTTIVLPNCLTLFDFFNFDSMHPINYESLKNNMTYQGIIKSLIAMRSRYLEILKIRYDALYVLNLKIKKELE
ncbi:MAG: DUF6090 family protein [Polaribacter sp.]|nr:DUF6090 family protein [Polaribacter sp.]